MIESVETADLISGHTLFTVKVSGSPIASFWCAHMADKLCEILTDVRNLPRRDAMRTLTSELGMCDDFAQGVYSALFGQPTSTKH